MLQEDIQSPKRLRPGLKLKLPQECSTVSTNDVINVGMLSPIKRRYAYANELLVSPSSSQKRSPTLNMSSDFSTLPDVAMPSALRFETWWFESGVRHTAHVSYDTAQRLCTCSLGTTTPKDGTASSPVSTVKESVPTLEPWDLHVGATLKLMGRGMELKRTADIATSSWVDAQGRLLLREVARLTAALEKYRQVISGSGQMPARRCDSFDVSTHEHSPLGGRANLANMRAHVAQLLTALRQHQRVLPAVRGAVAGALSAPSSPIHRTGPLNWGAKEREVAREEAERQLSERLRTTGLTASPRPSFPSGPVTLETIKAVPLAASAAKLTDADFSAHADALAVARSPRYPSVGPSYSAFAGASIALRPSNSQRADLWGSPPLSRGDSRVEPAGQLAVEAGSDALQQRVASGGMGADGGDVIAAAVRRSSSLAERGFLSPTEGVPPLSAGEPSVSHFPLPAAAVPEDQEDQEEEEAEVGGDVPAGCAAAADAPAAAAAAADNNDEYDEYDDDVKPEVAAAAAGEAGAEQSDGEGADGGDGRREGGSAVAVVALGEEALSGEADRGDDEYSDDGADG